MKISEIKIQSPFKDLFPIQPSIKFAIIESIKKHGYDESKPVSVWNNILLDGHTRLEAARESGITDIPSVQINIQSDEEAFDYAVRSQRDRRNLTDADILRLVAICDNKKKPEFRGNRYTKNSSDISNEISLKPSSEATAEKIGVSTSKVASARTVIEKATPEIKQQVESGEKSIRKAADEIREKEKHEKQEAKSTFNQTNDNIEWAKWSWNPVTGCLHDCSYCYAREIANRFFDDFQPRFHESRLLAPQNTKIPLSDLPGMKNVFVCSMADLFGHWVPKEWIEKVLESVRNNPQWTFLFLTKNPMRMTEFDFPANSWAGTTIDKQFRVNQAEEAFSKINATVKFISCEPMLEKIELSNPSLFDWVIIGGGSKTAKSAATQPEWEWVESLMTQCRETGCKIYFKPNLLVRPKEYPVSE